MGGRSKLVWRIGIAIILMANGLVFMGAVLLQSILGVLAILVVAVFDLYCFRIDRWRRRRTKKRA